MGVLSILILLGCAAQKPLWGDPETGLILTYRAVDGNPRQYQNTVTVLQDLAMIGQKTQIKSDLKFTVASKGMDAQNMLLGITVDTFRVDISGSQGSSTLDTSGIPGKGFDMILSPEGREVDVSGAAELTYDTSPFAKSSLKPVFVRIFPDLPSRPVTVGDTWTSESDTTTESGNGEINSLVEYDYKLEGVETFGGLACVKITGKMTGAMKGKGSQMGSEFTMGGKIAGTSTWYFAYKEGALVKHVTEFGGDIDIRSAMGSMPMKLANTEELILIQ